MKLNLKNPLNTAQHNLTETNIGVDSRSFLVFYENHVIKQPKKQKSMFCTICVSFCSIGMPLSHIVYSCEETKYIIWNEHVVRYINAHNVFCSSTAAKLWNSPPVSRLRIHEPVLQYHHTPSWHDGVQSTEYN